MQMPLLCMPLAFKPRMTSVNSQVSLSFKIPFHVRLTNAHGLFKS